jgi:hypothetical protein
VKGQEWIYRSAEGFIHKFWYVTKHGPQMTSFGSWLAGSAALEVFCVFALTMFGITIFFLVSRHQNNRQSKIKGYGLC